MGDAAFRDLSTGQTGDHPAPLEDDDPVAQCRQLIGVGRGHEDSGPALGGLQNLTVQGRLGPDVDPLGGLVGENDLGAHPQPLGEDQLLLVAAAEGSEG